MFEHIASGLFGFLLGLAFQRFWKWTEPARALVLGPDRPARLVPNTTFDTSLPALDIEPPHRLPQWQTYTRSALFWGWQCHTPLNVRDMRNDAGLTYPELLVYLELLEKGGVIRRTRTRTRWLMGRADCRKATMTTILPHYPRDYDPPPTNERKHKTGKTERNRTGKG